MTEFGMVMEPSPGYSAKLAARIEDLGFDILLSPDTQNLNGDVYMELCLAAHTTKRLRLGPGVTHPVTRVAAVTASAIATLQAESNGRAICGMGRGDSSAAHIGRRQATTEEVRKYTQDVQTYLRGDIVHINGTESKMRWIDPELIPPAPVDIACTGPKTIRMAADVAERVSFAVGSAPERLEWALNVFNERLEETGRPREDVQVGAYVNLVCDPDENRAIKVAKTVAGLVAHFTGMKHAPVDHLPPQLKRLAVKLKTEYDMARHAQNEGSHLELVDDEFVDWFTIAGPPAKCIERLGGLVEMGLQHVYVLGGSDVSHPHGARMTASVEQVSHFAEHVLPHFR